MKTYIKVLNNISELINETETKIICKDFIMDKSYKTIYFKGETLKLFFREFKCIYSEKEYQEELKLINKIKVDGSIERYRECLFNLYAEKRDLEGEIELTRKKLNELLMLKDKDESEKYEGYPQHF